MIPLFYDIRAAGFNGCNTHEVRNRIISLMDNKETDRLREGLLHGPSLFFASKIP